MGRLAPVKNHKLFIDAIKVISDSSLKKIRAFIIGDGELKEQLIQLCKDNELSFSIGDDNPGALVTFTSWIKDIEEAYPGLDIVAMTSLNEGTPVSLIEAQAANTPIITTNVGGIENIVIPNKTAVLTNNNDLEDFSTKLKQLVENDQLRTKQAEMGWIHVREKFHYTRLVKDVESLYYELLNQ